MNTQDDQAPPGPLELIESARTKYTLALSRARRGPPELALLSVHGSLEDALRAHGMRLGLAEVYEPFPQLLTALTAVDLRPLSAAEADSIRHMHRLRARIAHGEQIVVTAETLLAYHRLAARLLPRYGVVVITPGALEPEAGAATSTTVPGRRGDTTAIIRRDAPETRRRGDTAALDRNLELGPPRRERTVYPDDRPARHTGRVMPSAATRDLPLARQMLAPRRRPGWEGRLEELWDDSQRWLLPAVIVISIFLVGLVISASLGQMRAGPAAPTAALALTPIAPPPAATAAPGAAPPAPTADPALAPTAAPAQPGPGEPAVGRTAIVRADAGVNVRQSPGTAPDNPALVIIDPGTAVEIVGGPASADGFVWWQVRVAGSEGWVAAPLLEVQ